MDLDQFSDSAVLEWVGERITRIRLERNLSQQALADQAGLALRTVQRLEDGAVATQLSGFVRVCRVLGILGRLPLLLPEPRVSPIAQLKLKGKARRRASGRRLKGLEPGMEKNMPAYGAGTSAEGVQPSMLREGPEETGAVKKWTWGE